MRFAWTAMLFALLLTLSGCTDSSDDLDADGAGGDDPDDGGAAPSDGDGEDGGNGGESGDDAPREPIIITGTALAVNPAGPVLCARNGVDGEYDAIGQKVNGWSFTVEPDGYTAYWWDSSDGYLDGGSGSGTVPSGAANVEVCNQTGLPGDYTVTISPPG